MNKEEKLKLRELYLSANADQRHILEEFYPELKDSEGERIRKALIDEIKTTNARYSLFDDVPKDRFIAWLEQQGEKNLSNEHIWLYIVDDVLTWKNGIGQYLDNTEVQELAKKLCSKYAQKLYNPSVSSNIENNKQEPVDEPEFKVGDWITFTRKDGTREVLQISDIIDGRYYFNHLLHFSWSVKDCNEKCHLWTIADAKNGDVLAMGDVICIFKKMDTAGLSVFWTHCEIIGNSELGLGFSFSSNTIINPATKEQRDLLFQKIQEFGYKWENNQLEKINVNEDYIDLGLPSGTLWAKCNLGAEKETDLGLFYQWGETKGYSGDAGHDFSWNTYKWNTNGNLTKYNKNDNKLILDNEDDPAYVATDGRMKSPTKEQLQELIDYTNHEWIENFEGSGVNGMKFVSKSDDTKYIFIPAAGYCNDGDYDDVGSCGYIWSASRDKSSTYCAWYMDFSAGDIYMYDYYGDCGFNVRGVLNK